MFFPLPLHQITRSPNHQIFFIRDYPHKSVKSVFLFLFLFHFTKSPHSYYHHNPNSENFFSKKKINDFRHNFLLFFDFFSLCPYINKAYIRKTTGIVS